MLMLAFNMTFGEVPEDLIHITKIGYDGNNQYPIKRSCLLK